LAPVRLRIEVGATEALGPGLEQLGARGGEALGERALLLRGQRRALAQPRLQRMDGLAQPLGRRALPLSGNERLELGGDRLALLRLRGERERVAVLVALEERVAGGPETLPHLVRLLAAHRADRLPLRLQAADLGRGRVPLARGGERFRTRDQRLLGREV